MEVEYLVPLNKEEGDEESSSKIVKLPVQKTKYVTTTIKNDNDDNNFTPMEQDQHRYPKILNRYIIKIDPEEKEVKQDSEKSDNGNVVSVAFDVVPPGAADVDSNNKKKKKAKANTTTTNDTTTTTTNAVVIKNVIVPVSNNIQLVQERLNIIYQKYFETKLLLPLIQYAILEDIQSVWYSIAQSSSNSSNNKTNNNTDDDENIWSISGVSLSMTNLIQKIKQALLLLSQQAVITITPTVVATSTISRRSTTNAANNNNNNTMNDYNNNDNQFHTWQVMNGGRLAKYLLEEHDYNNNNDDDDDSNKYFTIEKYAMLEYLTSRKVTINSTLVHELIESVVSSEDEDDDNHNHHYIDSSILSYKDKLIITTILLKQHNYQGFFGSTEYDITNNIHEIINQIFPPASSNTNNNDIDEDDAIPTKTTTTKLQWDYIIDENYTDTRTSFSNVRIYNDILDQQYNNYLYQQHEQLKYDEKLKLDFIKYRTKSIQKGYCILWDIWDIKQMSSTDDNDNGNDDENNDIVTTDNNNDIDKKSAAVVAALTSTPTSSLSRRSRNKTNTVFYGNQLSSTTTSMKQLMDAVLIQCNNNGGSTLIELLQCDESSTDPVKRIRTALGRLLWKRNQIQKLHVQCYDKNIYELTTTANDNHDDASTTNSNGGGVDVTIMNKYIQTLHETEYALRKLVLHALTEIPIALVATAADERIGSMEALDHIDDESTVEWHNNGHELILSTIVRPPVQYYEGGNNTMNNGGNNDSLIEYQVVGYIPSVASTDDDDNNNNTNNNPAIREPTSVQRRIQFRVVSTENESLPPLILTEGQVRAGLYAAKLYQRHMKDRKLQQEIDSSNPLATGRMDQISLVPNNNNGNSNTTITGIVVGHDSVCIPTSNNHDDHLVVQNRILILPNNMIPGSNVRDKAFWASLDFQKGTGVMTCTIDDDDDDTTYSIQQFDYHPSSKAYKECLNIVRFLQRHPKGSPFLEPVDPVALGIPEYHEYIKHPMDVSTLLSKLERGEYASIPHGFLKGETPTVRMLNGPFRQDVELIFDNAMYFNPPDDWIHRAAGTIKNAVIKKIEQASKTAEVTGRTRKPTSMYIEYDSDVDMYVYESDQDDDFNVGGRKKRKRGQQGGKKQPPAKEDPSLRVMERGIRLEKVVSESFGVRGQLSTLPLNTNASEFSHPPGWSCRLKKSSTEKGMNDESERGRNLRELDELLSLHRQVEENEYASLRRSTRSADHDDKGDGNKSNESTGVEYYYPGCLDSGKLPVNRVELEEANEKLHEEHFAKMYQAQYKDLSASKKTAMSASNGSSISYFHSGFFPPFLGRVVPVAKQDVSSDDDETNDQDITSRISTWQIREERLVPALKWVIRGLVKSAHLAELESIDSTDGGVIVPNHIYYTDESETPFDVLDTRELTRRKRANNEAGDDSSEDEVELSEYEKARAERVARNAQRLQALGLA